MSYWQWVAFITLWFLIGPLFVVIFTSLGLDYYIGPSSTGRAREVGGTRPLRIADGARRPAAPRPIPAFSDLDESDDGPSAGLEVVWWMDRSGVEQPNRRVIGGD